MTTICESIAGCRLLGSKRCIGESNRWGSYQQKTFLKGVSRIGGPGDGFAYDVGTCSKVRITGLTDFPFFL